jgi:hypothetical protein
MDGKQVDIKTAPVESDEDSTVTCIQMKYPKGLTPVHFLRLALKRSGETVSSNFYLRSLEQNDFRAIRQLPAPKVELTSSAEQKSDRWHLTAKLENTGPSPALMVRVKVVREKTGDRILPAIYSDNYIALMPGESRMLSIEVNEADTRGEKPAVVLG